MQMPDDWNKRIIAEFRAHQGSVGGPFARFPLLLLHHTGAKTGIERVNPLAYQALDDGAWAIFGSKGGASSHPDWYLNLLANPRATIEVGTETVQVTARVARGEEREEIWSKQKKDVPGFAHYETRTSRQIPVVILERSAEVPTGSEH